MVSMNRVESAASTVSFINNIINHIPKCTVNSIKMCSPKDTRKFPSMCFQ